MPRLFRKTIRPLVIGLSALLLSMCGSDQPREADQEGASSTRRLVILNWDYYFSDELLKNFTKETGIEVVWDRFETENEARTRLTNDPSSADLVVLPQASLRELRDLGLVRALDPDRLPELKNVGPRFLSDHKNELVGIPYLWGTTCLVYDKRQFSQPPTSWSVLGDEKGGLHLLDEPTDMADIAQLVLGVKPSEATAKNREDALLIAKGWIESADKISSFEAVVESIAQGQSRVGVCWSGDAALAALENENLGYLIPEEGAPLWIDGLAMTRTIQNIDEAHEFLKFLLRPEVAAANANALRYATTNQAAHEFLDPALLGDEVVHPPESVLDLCVEHPLPSREQAEYDNAVYLLLERRKREIEADHPPSLHTPPADE